MRDTVDPYFLSASHHYGMNCAICQPAASGGLTPIASKMPSVWWIKRLRHKRRMQMSPSSAWKAIPQSNQIRWISRSGENPLIYHAGFRKGLYSLPHDLLCSVNPTHYFFILICANNTWRNITSESLHKWLEKWINGLVFITVHCWLLTLVIIAINSPRCWWASIAHFLASPVYVFRATNICSILPSGVTKRRQRPTAVIAVSAGRTLDAIPSGGDGNSAA